MSELDSTPSTSRPGSPVAPLPDFNNSRPYRFTWDASTRKPGPASVSGTSEGRGDYITYRPSLGNINLSASSLALGGIPQGWSSAKFGFNAISTVVNSPHKRSAPPKAHESVPPVPPVILPRVRRKDFESYLKAVAPDWDQFERNVQRERDAPAEAESNIMERFLQTSGEFSTSPRGTRFSSGQVIPPLESIPTVFFEKDFDLGDPHIFALVTEQDEDSQNTVDPASLSYSLPLLEKLSHYADTIELHLIREISIRSSSFFAALTNLNDLQSESAQCLERIRKLRGMLTDIDTHSARKGIEAVRLECKLQNMGAVKEGTQIMQSVGEMFTAARSLANAGEWNEALGVVDNIHQLWEPSEAPKPTQTPQPRPSKGRSRPVSSYGQPSQLSSVQESPSEDSTSEPKRPLTLPLKTLTAFASLPEHLKALTLEIATSLTTELVTLLKTDLLVQLDRASHMNGGSSQDAPPPVLEKDPDAQISLSDQLKPLLLGLKRTNGLQDSVAKWREVALAEVRACVKRLLPTSDGFDDDEPTTAGQVNSDKATALRNQLRAMTHSDFMYLSRKMYGTLLSGIEDLQMQNSVILELLSGSISPDDLQSLQTDLTDILSSASELAHSRASKVLSIRTEQHSTLEMSDFVAMFTETWNFVIATETICRKMIVGLRGVVVSQAKAFLQTLHQSRISQSAKLVEEEQWSTVEVQPASQVVANIIVMSAMRDPPELMLRLRDGDKQGTQVNGSTSVETPTASSKHLTIEDRKYFAVSATLETLTLLVDYLRVITNLSLLTTDAVGRIIEFLKAFNSRTCQVVLGAGAMRSAGLKNITAKHLALASQSLSIVIALIPYVRECFRRHLNAMQAVMLVEFDKLKRDFQEHQQEIHAKLIAIMSDRLSAHIKTLQAVNWETDRDNVNDYMTMLVKETVTLHKVLSRYLPEGVLEYIMSPVFASINHRLAEEYSKIELSNQAAKDRLLRDVRYLVQNLSALKNVNAPLGMLETVVLEKPLPRAAGAPPSPAPPPTPTPASAPVATPPKITSAASTVASKVDSANERIRSIFRRQSTMVPEKKPTMDETMLTPSHVMEKDGQKAVVEKVVEEGEKTPPPPPTPEKSGLRRVTSPPPVREDVVKSTKAVLHVEKELPAPVPEVKIETSATTNGSAPGDDSVASVVGSPDREESRANGANDTPALSPTPALTDVVLPNGSVTVSGDGIDTTRGSSS